MAEEGGRELEADNDALTKEALVMVLGVLEEQHAVGIETYTTVESYDTIVLQNIEEGAEHAPRAIWSAGLKADLRSVSAVFFLGRVYQAGEFHTLTINRISFQSSSGM